MTFAESLFGFIASVVTVLGGIALLGRYFLRRLDKWANAVIDNSMAVRSLTIRVERLEHAINDNSSDV